MDFTRIALSMVLQPFIALLFLYLAIKILKRKLNKMTLILSLFYLFVALSFVINIFFLPLMMSFVGYILYLIAAFLILFAWVYLLLFVKNLFQSNTTSFAKWDKIVLLLYAIIIISLISIPGSISINERTNWLPLFSWYFSILIYIFFTIIITIPFSFYAIKILITFKEKTLRKKYMYFIIGSVGFILAFYGLILYNTWYMSIFRTLWSIIVYIIVIPSALLIYYGIGKDL